MTCDKTRLRWIVIAALGIASHGTSAELMVSCPTASAQVVIVGTSLPAQWSQTPGVSNLTETRIDRNGPSPLLYCIYEAGNSVSRPLPDGIRDCRAAQGGFICEPGEREERSASDACAPLVQGQIAWNDSGDARWNEINVERLCRGTAAPAEPGLCFERVVHNGAVSEVDWSWEQALDFCEGTSDAAESIRCLKGELAQGQAVVGAIAACDGVELKLRR